VANARPAVTVSTGIVFRPNTGPGKLTHPYVVVAVASGTAFAVNWTDFLHYEESTCALAVGEHPQVTKPSVMLYPRFREFDVAVLGRELATGEQLLRLADLNAAVLERIVAGAKASPDLTDKIKRRYALIP
jgi:hypothetical protein